MKNGLIIGNATLAEVRLSSHRSLSTAVELRRAIVKLNSTTTLSEVYFVSYFQFSRSSILVIVSKYQASDIE